MLILARTTLCASLFAGLSFGFDIAHSQEPTSGSDPPAEQGTQPPTPDQPRADQPAITIKAIPGEGAEDKSNQEERDRREKAEVDRKVAFETQRVADYTFWLGAFSLGLFFAAIVQVALFFWQLRLIDRSLGDAKRAADAAAEGARAAKLSADSLQIIEGAYVFPEIVTEDIAGSLDALMTGFTVTNRLRVRYSFKNFGKTPAIIQSFSADLIHPDQVHLRSVNADARQTVRKTILGAGDSTSVAEPLETEITANQNEAAGIKEGRSHLYFNGNIRYADIWGNRWSFPFDWVYSPAQGRFIPDNQHRQKAG